MTPLFVNVPGFLIAMKLNILVTHRNAGKCLPVLAVLACLLLTLFPGRSDAQTLVFNPTFQLGLTNWRPRGAAALQIVTNNHLAPNSLLVTNRPGPDDGVAQALNGKLIPGESYYCAAWVRAGTEAPATVTLGMDFSDGTGTYSTNLTQVLSSNAGWSFLSGCFDVPPGGVQSASLFCAGPATGVSFLVDDVTVVPLTGFRLAARSFPNVYVGGVGGSSVQSLGNYGRTVISDYHICGTENDTKFANTHPGSNTWSFTSADTIVNVGITNGQQTRGHTLAWHLYNPTWLNNLTNTATPVQMQKFLYNHIDLIVGRYKDKLFCWDVVNEAVGNNGGIRDSIWYNQPGIGYAGQGSNYIAEIFKRARAAAPHTILVYNDYSNIEIGNKSDFMFNMLKGLKTQGAPVDAVGFQLHTTRDGPSISSMRNNLQRFNDLGLDIHITEMDVRIGINTNTGYATNPTDLRIQGDTYFNVFGTALAFPRTKVLQTWGYTDNGSWVPGQFPGYGAALPIDKAYDRKPAWWGMYNALANQVENFPVVATSGDTYRFVTNTSFSAGRAGMFLANATNDHVTFRATVPYAGEYTVQVGVNKSAANGQFQLAAAPVAGGPFVDLGAKQDLYATSSTFAGLTVATNTFTSAGDHFFRFTVAGKSNSSAGFTLTLDYLRLTPTGNDGNQPPSVDDIPDQTVLKNQTLGPVPFRIRDRETVEGALSLTVLSSSNPELLPTSRITLTRHGQQFLLYANPVTDLHGNATIYFRVQDADGARTTNSVNITVAAEIPNTAPRLAPIPDRALNAGQILVVTNAATDDQTPPQILTFTLLSAPPNASLNATNGVLGWRPTSTQADSTNIFSIRVTDDGVPSLSDTQAFTAIVNPLASPSLAALLRPDDHQFGLHVTGDSGLDYEIQISDDLIHWASVFTNVAPEIPFEWMDPSVSAAGNRFYRILLSL